MKESILEKIMLLKSQSSNELKAKYKELFNEGERSSNKIFLWRKIAYRLQEMEYGGLTPETQSHINKLIERYDPVNNKMFRPQKSPGKTKSTERDTRLPIPGAIIRKVYKGKLLEVKVLEKGFEYEEKPYRTLSAVAKAVTGIHWNGYLFFKP